ncbi:MAG: ExeM/NucH family extracellular endonuclease [Woeseiaceae bacterium]
MRRTSLFAPWIALLLLMGCNGGSGTNTPPPNNDPVVTPINQIQGSGSRSPLDDRSVTVTGVVTGDFQDNDADLSNNLGGFYLQGQTPDADPETSEGVFVYEGDSSFLNVSVGDQLMVEGIVNEHLGETQISATLITLIGSDNVQPVDVNLPAKLEQYEGMLIRLPQPLTVAGLYELERFGTVQLVAGGRSYAYTNQNAPDVLGYAAHRADFSARSILLDDGRLEQNLAPIRYLNASVDPGYSIRSGDTVTGLTGNLRYASGSGSSGTEGYRVVPTIAPQFASQNPRLTTADVNGSLRVASFNTLNFFSTIDVGQDDCGPSGSSGCRGADSADELERQLSKLVTALGLMDADITGLMEIENNAGVALQMIIDRLNEVSDDRYAFVNTGAVGNDVITTAFLYKPASVSLRGAAVVLDSTVDIRFDETRNRPAIAQSFIQNSNGAVFSVVVNHLKSKGSPCDDGGDPDLNDGQGNCNRTRTLAAAALADWTALDPTNSGDADYLVIGDLNAFVFEDPLTALKNNGFTNLLEASVGGDYWSSVYAGESGALDHALANASLVPQVTDVISWHINADEPTALDYNTEISRDAALFDAAEPFRTSDHDPIIVGLDLSP